MKSVYILITLAGIVAIVLPKPQETTKTTKIIRMKVTAYCACTKCCGADAIGKTSTGKDAYHIRGIAAAPKLLPYKTRLNIPGVGILPVDDTGGAMRQDAKKGIYHIDVRFCPKDDNDEKALEKAHQEARKFGVKWLNVEVLD